MSLAQHVTQSEGFDYVERLAEDGPADGADERAALLSNDGTRTRKRPEWRYMRFGLGPKAEQEQGPRAAAYEISVGRRCAQVATGVVACWLGAGIVFGFAALKPILVSEGLYSELCDGGSTHSSGEHGTVPCGEQDLRLNLFFVVASVTTNVASLLAGSVLDAFGRRPCFLAACAFLLGGSLLFAASFAVPALDGFLVANALLSAGGTFILVASFQLVNAFPKYAGGLVAVMTGAFDASSAVFLLYSLVYEATGGGVSPSYFFVAYSLVPVCIAVAEVTYMPPRAYHDISALESMIGQVEEGEEQGGVVAAGASQRAKGRADSRAKLEHLAGDAAQRDDRRKWHTDRQAASRVWGVLHGASPRRQMLSPWFVLILVLTAVEMLRMNYFIATIRAQYRYMLGEEGPAARVNGFFDVALPVAGVAATPLIGVMLNNLSVPAVFGVVTVLVAVVGVLNCLPYLWAGYATVVAFVVFRPLYYSAVSDYATKVFGFKSFGRIYGTIVCCSGFTNLAQSGLDAVTHEVLGGDPTPINVVFGVTGTVVGAALSIFVAVGGRDFAKRHGRVGP